MQRILNCFSSSKFLGAVLIMNKRKLKHLSSMLLAILLSYSSALARQADSFDSVPDGASLKINFVISEPCSLVTFLDTLSAGPHTTSWFADWFLKKRKAEVKDDVFEKDQGMVKAYGSLMEDTPNSYEFKDKAGVRGLNLNQEIITLAAECSSLPELFDKLNGKVKEQDLQTLKKVLEYFAPIYHSVVYEPRLASLKQQLAEFEKGTASSKMIERLAAVQQFMKSPWNREIPFTIVLLPLPEGGHSTHGESLGVVQVVELMPKMQFKDHADVVFHEACHALWGVKTDLDQVKSSFDGLDGGKTAYSELNEGMATALGQGWFTKEAFGKSSKNWYNDEIISGYAHVLMPVLVDYLNINKPIDGEFALRATEAFNNRFVNVESTIKNTGSFCVVAKSIDDPSKFRASLWALLPRLHSYSASEPLTSPESIKSFKEDNSEHKAFLLSANDLHQMRNFGFSDDQIDFLRAHRQKPTTIKAGNSDVLFCIADTPTKQQAMLMSELSKKQWSAATSIN